MKITHLLLLAIFVLPGRMLSQIPILNSNPSITSKVVYLDFDGQTVSGTAWNSGNTVNALPSLLGNAAKIDAWRRVCEDYRPFDVNITTDSVRFNNAPANKRMRVIITPTSQWYTPAAGGVAYVGSFAWGGTPGTPCWIFENQLGYNTKNVAEAISHEVGHTLSLRHQSTYNSSCVKTAEYNPGQGSGVTGWAPIMGVGYSKNVTTWYIGKSSVACTTLQYDHSNNSTGITGSPFLSFLPDDVGDVYASAKILNLSSLNVQDSGTIGMPSDIDAYRFTICNNRYVSFAVKPWALDTTNYNGANLDVRFSLFNATTNSLIAVDTSLTRLHTLAGINLTAGSYYFTVDGGGSANYSDYGSLGKYYISIKATNPPLLTNTIVNNPAICLNQSTAFNYTSNGTPTFFQWTFSGPVTPSTSPSATVPSVASTSASPAMTFTAAGIYTVGLIATSSTSTSCQTTKTLSIEALPTLTVTPSSLICFGSNTQLGADGAMSYVWTPGNFSGSVQIVSPTVTTSYTVTGSNAMCSNSAVTTVSVNPNFTLNVSASNTLLCTGQSVTFTASGATGGYTLNPGNVTALPAVLSPTVSTAYFIAGSDGVCTKSITKLVVVSPDFSLQAAASNSVFCAGQSVSLTASGAVSYTFNPGGITANPAVVTPTAPVSYTVTGANINNCKHVTTVDVMVSTCEGIAEQTAENRMSIFPNPAAGEINIHTTSDCYRIEIMNALGGLVFEKNNIASQVKIDTGTWANGVYIVRAHLSNGEFMVQKLVVGK